MNEPVLCYVDGPWAYFTTQKLENQWGDDWNDAPYEHNAGPPYEYNEKHDKRKQPWEIIKVAFYGYDLRLACDHHLNSPYSVQQINVGAVAWIIGRRKNNKTVAIPAGVKFSKFCKLMRDCGGKVYAEVK